jgi:nucleotide-binding universal stress UspA family protein
VYPSRIQTTEILYATDFSEPARRAFACAKEIARRRGYLLRSLHVVDLIGGIGAAHSSFNSALEFARRALRSRRRELRLAGIREDITVVSGSSVSMAIRDALVRRHAALLVMGLHGEPGITIPTFGGNVRRLFRSAPCPMLTVGLRGPVNPTPAFERTLFVTDTAPESIDLALKSWPLDNPAAALAHFVVLPPEGISEAAAPMSIQSSLPPPRLVAHDQAAALILAMAQEAQADLIVVSLRGGGYLDLLGRGSIVRAIWTQGACPVLTARTNTEMTAPLRERFLAAKNRKPTET